MIHMLLKVFHYDIKYINNARKKKMKVRSLEETEVENEAGEFVIK